MNLFKNLFKKNLPDPHPVSEDNHSIISDCPYCQKKLDKIPTRKTKCPFCNNDIFIRSTQDLFPNTLLTKDQSLAVDAFKDLEFSFNLSNRDYYSKQEELLKKFGKEPNPRDIIWGLFNNLLSKTANLQKLSQIYYLMVNFLSKEGKDPFELQKKALEIDLRNFKEIGFKKVQIFTALDKKCCSSCKKLEKKKLTIDEALKTQPIPVRDCGNKKDKDTFGICRCTYVSES